MKKKDYCIKKAFENLQRVSQSQHIQKIQEQQREEEYEKTVRLLNLMKGAR
jgi:hypothetical protein